MPDAAIQLVNPRGDGGISVCPDAIRELRIRLSGSIGRVLCVAIVGSHRSGKSTLANVLHAELQPRLSDKSAIYAGQSGFGVSDGTEPCTQGVSANTVTLLGGTLVLILDVEGLDASNQATNYSDKLLSLAMLLAGRDGVILYNSSGAINASAVDNVRSIAVVADSIAMAAGSEIVTGVDPHFVWVLRNFTLKYAAGISTATQYMNSALAQLPGLEDIDRIFHRRQAVAVPQPPPADVSMALLALPPDEMGPYWPAFKKGLDGVVECIRTIAQRQASTSGVLTAGTWCSWCETVVALLESPSSMSLYTSKFEAMLTLALVSARRAGKCAYDDAYLSPTATSLATAALTEARRKEHERCWTLASAKFTQCVLQDQGGAKLEAFKKAVDARHVRQCDQEDTSAREAALRMQFNVVVGLSLAPLMVALPVAVAGPAMTVALRLALRTPMVGAAAGAAVAAITSTFSSNSPFE